MSAVNIQAPNTNQIKSIYCGCQAPSFKYCQALCGVVTMIFSGAGLEWCCFYGCDKPDCCTVCLAGFLMDITGPCIIGWVVACIVGFHMVC